MLRLLLILIILFLIFCITESMFHILIYFCVLSLIISVFGYFTVEIGSEGDSIILFSLWNDRINSLLKGNLMTSIHWNVFPKIKCRLLYTSNVLFIVSISFIFPCRLWQNVRCLSFGRTSYYKLWDVCHSLTNYCELIMLTIIEVRVLSLLHSTN